MATDTEVHATSTRSTQRPVLMLGLATLGFGLNFWAWALLSPLVHISSWFCI